MNAVRSKKMFGVGYCCLLIQSRGAQTIFLSAGSRLFSPKTDSSPERPFPVVTPVGAAMTHSCTFKIYPYVPGEGFNRTSSFQIVSTKNLKRHTKHTKPVGRSRGTGPILPFLLRFSSPELRTGSQNKSVLFLFLSVPRFRLLQAPLVTPFTALFLFSTTFKHVPKSATIYNGFWWVRYPLNQLLNYTRYTRKKSSPH